MDKDKQLSYGVCGLNCSLCEDKTERDECHGCKCPDKDCAADCHQSHCRIYKCAMGKGYVTCADCDDMPCCMLIGFCYDPEWPEHLPVIENLRRIQKIGLEAWIDEEAEWQKNTDIQPL